MKNKRSLGFVLSYTNTFLSMICGLFLSSFLIRQYGGANYGVYQTISSFATYLVLLEFGTGTVISRNLTKSRMRQESPLEIEKNISTVWTITTALSALIVLVSVLFYVAIPLIYSESLTMEQISLARKMFVLIVVFIVSSFVSQTLNGIALAYEHYTFASSISIVKLISRTILLVCLTLFAKSIVIIPLVDAILGVVIAGYSYIYCVKSFKVKINYKNFDKLILKASLPLCMAIFLQAIINQSNSSIGKFVLGVMATPENVTLYSIALYIHNILSSVSTIPVSMYVPQVTKDVTSGLGGIELTKTLVNPCRLIVFVGGTVLFGFSACGKQFIQIVYGKEYIAAWVMTLILCVPTFFDLSNSIVLNVLDAKNKRLTRSYMLLFTTTLNIIITILGIKHFGIIAAPVATGLAVTLQVILMNIYYQKVIEIDIPYLFLNVFKGLLPFQIAGAIIGYFVGTLIANVYISFVAAGFTYVIIAFGCFYLFGKTESESQLIKGFVDKVLRKSK